MRLSKSAKAELGGLDTGYSIFLVDREFLKKQDPLAPIRTMATLLRVKGILGNYYTMLEYIISTIRILAKDKDSLVEAVITYKLYIINKLNTNILIGTNIILSKKIDMLLLRKSL